MKRKFLSCIVKRKIWSNKYTLVYLSVFLSLLYSSPLLAKPSINVTFTPKKIKQGDILFITVKANPGIYKISGSLFDKPVHFYTDSKRGSYVALIGIDMETEPNLYILSIFLEDESGREMKKDYKIRVKSAKFGIQRLTLPKEKVELDEETLKRVNLEQEKIGKVWDIFTEENLWDGNFIRPIEGKFSGSFGLRRIINDEPKNPHTGIDIDAPEGAPVYAPNHGRVVFANEHFFSGKSLVIDHGMGLFTMYFHLSEILVATGDSVKKGQIMAKVGKSGRATGPHLHWGMRLNGARVNPASLINLPLE